MNQCCWLNMCVVCPSDCAHGFVLVKLYLWICVCVFMSVGFVRWHCGVGFVLLYLYLWICVSRVVRCVYVCMDG